MIHHLLSLVLKPNANGQPRRQSLVAVVFAVLAILCGGMLFVLLHDIKANPRPNEGDALWNEMAFVAFSFVAYGFIVIWRWIVAFMADWDC